MLVTGCGGDIGQSIGKILKANKNFKKVIGCDLNNNHAGKFIFDRTHILPSCREPGYLDSLKTVLEEEEIDIIIPISEPELRFFNEMSVEEELFGRVIVMANKRAMDIGFDKLLTAQFLKSNSLPYPITNILNQLQEPILPVVIKSRDGAGSKNLFIVTDGDDLPFYVKKYPNFIAQEFIGNDSLEYTCGLFRSTNKEIRQIIFRRKLMGGFSGFGVYEENQAISNLLNELAQLLDLNGSINVQLRLTEKGPCIFEINPRFSSTVLFRDLLGFNDVIWSIENALGLPVSSYNRKIEYTKFYKGFNEYVD